MIFGFTSFPKNSQFTELIAPISILGNWVGKNSAFFPLSWFQKIQIFWWQLSIALRLVRLVETFFEFQLCLVFVDPRLLCVGSKKSWYLSLLDIVVWISASKACLKFPFDFHILSLLALKDCHSGHKGLAHRLQYHFFQEV